LKAEVQKASEKKKRQLSLRLIFERKKGFGNCKSPLKRGGGEERGKGDDAQFQVSANVARNFKRT